MPEFYIKIRLDTTGKGRKESNILKRLCAECGNTLYDLEDPMLKDTLPFFKVNSMPVPHFTGEEGPGYIGAELYFHGEGQIASFIDVLKSHISLKAHLLAIQTIPDTDSSIAIYYRTSPIARNQKLIRKVFPSSALSGFFNRDFQIGNRVHIGMKEAIEAYDPAH